MLTAFLPKIGALLAERGVQAVAAGVLSGAVVGGAGVASGLIPVGGAQAAPTVALLACPDSGPELGRVSSGQTLLVTARSVDGSWLEVYVGEPGAASGWLPASGLRLQAAADGLPIHSCGITTAAQPSIDVPPGQSVAPPATIVATVPPTLEPTLAPGASPRPTGTARPTPSPSRAPTPKPTPVKTATAIVTPPPTPVVTPIVTPLVTPVPNHPPTASGLARSSDCIDNGSTYTASYVTVTATDPDAGDALTVRIRFGRIYNGNTYIRLSTDLMTRVGVSNQWTFTITQTQLQGYGWNSSTGDSEVTYTVTAYDSLGAPSNSLHSHDDSNTMVFYRSWAGCQLY